MRPWWWRVSAYGRGEARSLSAIVVLALLGASLNALKPWPLKLILDSVLAESNLPAWAAWTARLPGAASPIALLAWFAGASLFLVILAEITTLLRNYIQAGAGSRMQFALSGALFAHMQRLSLLFHYRRATGDLVRRVTTDAKCIQDLLLGVFIPLLTATTNLVIMGIILWSIAPMMAFIAMAVAVPLAFGLRYFSRPMNERSYAYHTAEGGIMTAAERTLAALPVVQAFGREGDEDIRFAAHTDAALRAHLRLTGTQIQYSAASAAATALGTAAVLGVGGLQVLDGNMTLGTLVVVLAYLVALYTPLQTLTFLSSGFAAAAAPAQRVFEILDSLDHVTETDRPQEFPGNRARGYVRFADVAFSYEAGKPVLQGIDLQLAPGEVVALVGPTGGGKTTIASLLLRFYDPQEGQVALDGIDARNVLLKEWRSQIAVVPQDPLILPISVRDNIAYGQPGASDEEVREAARASQCADFIEALPEGFDTIVGERGATLSGGEKQRISLARAFLKNAPIVILDEPTSSLDAKTEVEIVSAMQRLSRNHTTLVIAHRLSTVRDADRILFIDNGRVVESGGYEELIAKRGRFFEFQSVMQRTSQD